MERRTNQVKTDFPLIEFQRKGFPVDSSIKERFMLYLLIATLQFIRDEIGVPMIITDCYRGRERYMDMLSKGYYPSETSDHFFGQKMPVGNPAKVELYGKWFDLSAGAVDFKCIDIEKNFHKMVQMAMSGDIKIGQLILETNGNSKWIHISNDPEAIYGKVLASKLPIVRRPYLCSLDGGRTYINYEV